MTGATDPLVWAWALSPVVPRGEQAETAFQKIRLIGPEGIVRASAAAARALGEWVSEVAPAPPPLDDHLQVQLAATLAGYRRLLPRLPDRAARAIEATLARLCAPPPVMVLGRHRLTFGSRVYVAGILNNTPDSFYDRGRHFGLDAALARAEEIVREGADLIEVGGETAQEGPPVPVAEEIRRVAPLVAELTRRYDLPVAVDTYKPDVARAALEAGAVLVNDISGASDPRMAEVVAAAGAGLVVMHLHGHPRQRYRDLEVPSMMDWVAAFLYRRTEELVAAGVPRERILVDPGLDFGKHPARDVELMRRLPELRSLGYPVFVATSRKDYIRDLLGLPPDELLEGTAAAVAFAIAQGASMLRVHDVRAMTRVARMMEFFCGHAAPAPQAAAPRARPARAGDGEGEAWTS